MERTLPMDPTECKLDSHLNGTDNAHLNSCNYNNSFTIFDDFKKQQLLERYQPRFQITRLNSYNYGIFAYVQNSDLVLNLKYGATNVCRNKHEYIIEKDSWSLIVREVELTYDEKENTFKNIGHTLPCLHDDGFCHQTILSPYTFVWFPDDFCLLFSNHFFIGRMSKIGNRYWLETGRFFIESYAIHTPPSDSTSDKTGLSALKYILNKEHFATNSFTHHSIF